MIFGAHAVCSLSLCVFLSFLKFSFGGVFTGGSLVHGSRFMVKGNIIK